MDLEFGSMNSRCEFVIVYVDWYGDAMRYEPSGLFLCTCSFFGTANMVSRMD